MRTRLLLFFKSRIYIAVTLLISVLFLGVIGFKFLAGYSWTDALYMTVITITTVGFGEVLPLDNQSKIFAIILILLSVIIVGYALSVITEYILSKNNFENLKYRSMKKQINKLNDHIIICGFGRNGKQAAKKLTDYGKPFVVIEKNKAIIDHYENQHILFVEGNANQDDTLINAGINRASTLISALPNDADNLFVVLSARQINTTMNIISRASQQTSYDKLKLAGANNVILPDKIGGDHMASLVVVPDLIEFIDNLSIVGENNINIEQIPVEKLYDLDAGIKNIKDLDLRRKTGCNVIGFKSSEGSYILNPEPDVKLEANSKIIVLGRPEQIQKLNSLYDIE